MSLSSTPEESPRSDEETLLTLHQVNATLLLKDRLKERFVSTIIEKLTDEDLDEPLQKDSALLFVEEMDKSINDLVARMIWDFQQEDCLHLLEQPLAKWFEEYIFHEEWLTEKIFGK